MLPRWIAFTTIILMFFCIVGGACVSVYYAHRSEAAAATSALLVPVQKAAGEGQNPAVLTTDQILASVSTNITVLGGLIAVATVIIALAALYGYSELRTTTVRKTEEDLFLIISALEDSKYLPSATATILRQQFEASRAGGRSGNLKTGAGILSSSSEGNKNPPNASNVVQNESGIADYPEGDNA